MKKSIISADLMASAIKKLGAMVVDLAKDAIDYNAQMESYTASFANFTGKIWLGALINTLIFTWMSTSIGVMIPLA